MRWGGVATSYVPSLVGTTPVERAETRMWTRKVDLNIAEPMANGFRFSEGLELFKDRLHVIPQAADDLKATAQEWLAKLDGWIEGKQFICGDRFTMAGWSRIRGRSFQTKFDLKTGDCEIGD